MFLIYFHLIYNCCAFGCGKKFDKCLLTGWSVTNYWCEFVLCFLKREGKLWTSTYANNTKAQIDYVFINKKWNNSAFNCEAYSSLEGVSTNHQIVTAKIQLSLRKNATLTTITGHYDSALFNNRDIKDKYALTLRNKFDAIREKT